MLWFPFSLRVSFYFLCFREFVVIFGSVCRPVSGLLIFVFRVMFDESLHRILNERGEAIFGLYFAYNGKVA